MRLACSYAPGVASSMFCYLPAAVVICLFGDIWGRGRTEPYGEDD